MNNTYYFDDREIGLAKETSHPHFNNMVTNDFYYDLLDDYSPFGNDTGADTLMELEDWIQETKNDSEIMKWMYDYIDSFGFKYQSEGVSKLDHIEAINQILKEDELMIDCMDQAIIATGFGQIKITGSISKQLKVVSLLAIKRQKNISSKHMASLEYKDYLNVLYSDLTNFELQ